MGDVGVPQAEGKAKLVDRDAEETKISEVEVIVKRVADGLRLVTGGRENRKAAAKQSDGNHEEASRDNAKRREGEHGEITKNDFDDEEVDGPDGHQKSDGDGENGAGGWLTVRRFYEHGDEEGEAGLGGKDKFVLGDPLIRLYAG